LNLLRKTWLRRTGGFANRKIFETVKNSERKVLVDNGLVPSSKILDIGCGYGTLPVALKDFITDGAYEGFDVSQERVSFCRSLFRKDARFRFNLIDCKSDDYNPAGKLSARKIGFPYLDNIFDYTVLFSVFTHMTRDEVENYLGEIRRVLKPNGKCVATFFISDGKPPENGICFSPKDLPMLETQGFSYRWLNYGYWETGESPKDITYQDIFLLEKRA
jgi:SAM-dependent methyltransferase